MINYNVIGSINTLRNLVLSEEKAYKQIVFVCIGSIHSNYDAVGPLVGQLLNEYLNDNLLYTDYVKVYGNLNDTIDGLNATEKVEKIKETHKDALIIAIDAAISKRCTGLIAINKDSVHPGAGAGKSLPAIGNIAICGLVNKDNMGKVNIKRLYAISKTIFEIIKFSILENNKIL